MFRVSFTYPYQTQFGPGPGFFPLWISGMMIAFSLAFIYKILKQDIQGKFFKNKSSFNALGNYLILLFLSILFIPVIGLILSLGLFCLLTFRFFDNHSWKNSLTVSIGAMVIFYLIFVVWLKLPLPTGI